MPGLAVTVIAGQEALEWQGWRAIKNHQQGEYAATPTALYEWQAAGPIRLVTILYPTRPGGECPIAAVVASTAVEDTAIRLVLADGSSVQLSEHLMTECPLCH